MEFDILYKEFQENCNIIDGFYHYDDLNQYISENFYKLPFSASDVYMEVAIPELKINEYDKNKDGKLIKKDQGFIKLGKGIINALIKIVNLVLQLVGWIIEFVFELITRASLFLKEIGSWLNSKENTNIIDKLGKFIDGNTDTVTLNNVPQIGGLISSWCTDFNKVVNHIKNGFAEIKPQTSSVQYDFANNDYSYYKEEDENATIKDKSKYNLSETDKKKMKAFREYLKHQQKLCDIDFYEKSDIYIYTQGYIYLVTALLYLDMVTLINGDFVHEFDELLEIIQGEKSIHNIIQNLNSNEFNITKSIYPLLLYKYNDDNKSVPDKLKSNITNVRRAIPKIRIKVGNYVEFKNKYKKYSSENGVENSIISKYPESLYDIKGLYEELKKEYKSINRKELTSKKMQKTTPKGFKIIFKLIKEVAQWIKTNKAVITENKSIYKELNETKKVTEKLKALL